MNTLMFVLVGLLGLAIGSFLNVVIYRLPNNTFFKSGRSECRSCGRQLKWYHNIPLLSYLFLRGRCGFCHERISIRYPLVELLNAGGYLYFFTYLGLSYSFIVWALMVSALLAIFFIDLDHQIIPDSITLPGMVIGLAASFLPGGMGIVHALIGLVVGGGSLYVIAVLGDLLFKKEAMGGGDIKMAGMLGTFLGWQKVLLVFITSAAIGLVVSVIVMAFSSKVRETRLIPFGPFLALAALVSIIYGDRIIDYYLVHFVGIH